jgi:uncharacterized protein YeaO (DUF488 family)
MSFQFRTVQVGCDRQPDEGLRIGTVRFLPRGVPKAEYRARNLFDVWLPTLAPSRSLLRALKAGEVRLSTFFSRYRSEMNGTEPRQVIQLVAELARKTPISIGCYCQHEANCHRSVLGDLIREAAGEPCERPFASVCVYTIAHPEILEDFIACSGSAGVLREGKSWTSAMRIWHEAQSEGRVLPILFADATDCSRLIFSARMDGIVLGDGGTQFAFSGLKRIPGNHSPQELVLESTGGRIAQGFIRPYALVRTPKFIRSSRHFKQ